MTPTGASNSQPTTYDDDWVEFARIWLSTTSRSVLSVPELSVPEECRQGNYTLASILRLSFLFKIVSNLIIRDGIVAGRVRVERNMQQLLRDIQSLSDRMAQRTAAQRRRDAKLAKLLSREYPPGEAELKEELKACVEAEVDRVAEASRLLSSLQHNYEQVKRDVGDALDRIAKDGGRAGYAEGSVSAATAEKIRNLFSETDRYFAALSEGLSQRNAALKSLRNVLPWGPDPPPPPLNDVRVQQNASCIVSGLGAISSSIHATTAPKKLAIRSNELTRKADQLRDKCDQVLLQVARVTADAASPGLPLKRRFFENPVAKVGKVLGVLVGEYSKLHAKFATFSVVIEQFLWFAVSTAAEKRADHRMAEDVVESAWSYSRNQSPYLRPLDFALKDVEQGLLAWRAALRCYLE
ncbi:hypothetical protein HMN09_01165000 [Mycena chlorophos]|uniref:Uncharacterized protein n=1 Tax=Mycena chlorophos TaxID=658473 RepID=A0A8H6S9P6_MYCCL|nr:hypothetical protein HMN09_01165000 [Mycena chlorophos]